MVLTVVGYLPASAAPFPATVSGVVRDARGTPQMGAMVELLAGNSSVVARVYTNVRGAFTFDHIFPGTYQVKATGDSFLPTLREDLQLRARSKVVVNITLSTLFEAIQWLPAQPRSPDEPTDDWKWTLRSSTNRPLLRLLQDGPLVVLSGDDHGSGPQLAARVSVTGPAREFGQGGPHHAFAIERSSAVGGHLILRANLSPQPTESSEYMAGYQLALGPERQIRNVATVQRRRRQQRSLRFAAAQRRGGESGAQRIDGTGQRGPVGAWGVRDHLQFAVPQCRLARRWGKRCLSRGNLTRDAECRASRRQ
jgi:hypothetical protein